MLPQHVPETILKGIAVMNAMVIRIAGDPKPGYFQSTDYLYEPEEIHSIPRGHLFELELELVLHQRSKADGHLWRLGPIHKWQELVDSF